MSNAVYSPIGSNNGGSDVRELFLKTSTGEVLSAFAKDAEFMDKHMVRTISSGKSAQFPATGRKAEASYHTPGTEILGSEFKQSERVITIDNILQANHFFSDIDEAMTHFDVRSPVTQQIGEVLAQAFNTNVAVCALLGARASGVVDGMPGGSKLVNADFKTDSNAMAEGIFGAATTLDEKYIPDSERNAFVKPAQYYALAQNTKVINKDWDGRGSYAEGSVVKIADIPIIKAKHLPSTNITSGLAKYQGDFSNTAALVMHKGAVGTVKLMDMALTSDRLPTRLGEIMIARYAMGHDYLRPECSVELAVA